jgi:hypothetical protein
MVASPLLRRLSAVFLLMTALTTSRAESLWERIVWKGEPAWVSSRGAVSAVVSEARSRLIYLGAADGSLNLLNAPVPAPAPANRSDSPNWGGHRFWLGPQTRWVWPPPVEWEHSAAAGSETRGAVLMLRQPRIDPEYPAITREYEWDGARLRCTARWLDDGRPCFGLHVVAVNVPFAVTVRLVKGAEAPAGMVAAQMVDPPSPLTLPHAAITVDGDRATVRAGVVVAKLGFVPQALVIERPGGWKLSMQPGPHEGVALVAPDHGYVSQVWVGDKNADLAELEQLTPCLRGDAAGRCASTIYLEATAPRQP